MKTDLTGGNRGNRVGGSGSLLSVFSVGSCSKILAALLLCVFALKGSAQTVLTAEGLATFGTNAPSGGGGGGGPCTPSYGNPGGTGNRPSIVITASAGFPVTAKWVDGDNTSNGQFFLPNASLNGSQFIRFDFGSGKSAFITEAKYYQQGTTAQGTWKWQGSNDASSWTDIGGSFALGGIATETITALSGNTTGYRYYQIVGLSGSSSAGPWVYEMEFKICGL